MSRSLLILLAATTSLALTGCSPQQNEQTAEQAGNAADTMAQSTEGTGAAAGNAAEGAGNAAGSAAGGARDAAGKPTEIASNAGVTARIKNALFVATGIQGDINVDTTDTQVILKGHAHTAQEKQQIEQIAKAQAGNRTIVNQIEVVQH
jgi:osmotically-inducible protein OsmY